MNHDETYRNYLVAIKTLSGLYAKGYMLGLKRMKYGSSVVSDDEHKRYMADTTQISEGYKDGFEFLPPKGTGLEDQGKAKKTELVKFRTTKKQKQALTQQSERDGYKNLSAWALDTLLDKVESDLLE